MTIYTTGGEMQKPTRTTLRSLNLRQRRAVVFEFPIALDDRLRAVAAQRGTSKSAIVRGAVARALEALEAEK